jgi:hypothetical protein
VPDSVNDPVGQVIRGWAADRPARLIRRFRHGVGGTSGNAAPHADGRRSAIQYLFDIETGRKARPAVIRRLWTEIEDRIPSDVLALYVALYAVRYASWAIGTRRADVRRPPDPGDQSGQVTVQPAQ